MMSTYNLVDPAIRLIHEQFNQELKIDELSDICSLSRSQFHHNFKRIIGIPPLEYQRQRRLEETKRLLFTSDLGIGQIGRRVGWDDPFHFSRIFKQYTGYSPSEFRHRFMESLTL